MEKSTPRKYFIISKFIGNHKKTITYGDLKTSKPQCKHQRSAKQSKVHLKNFNVKQRLI